MEPYRTTMKAIIKKIGYDYDIYLWSLKTLDFIFNEDHATHDENDTD